MCAFRTCPLFEFLTTFARDEMREREIKLRVRQTMVKNLNNLSKYYVKNFVWPDKVFFSGFYSRFILIYSCKYMHV